MKNQTYRMTMLFDFYGEVLTDRQKEFFDLYYNEDLSLAEIAENSGISRQGVRDVIVRAEGVMPHPPLSPDADPYRRHPERGGGAEDHQLPAVRGRQDRRPGRYHPPLRPGAEGVKEVRTHGI